MRLLVVLALIPLTLAACSSDTSKADSGLLVGAAAGGLLGNVAGGRSTGGRVVGTIAGAFIGGIAGHQIGRSLDKQDRIFAQQAEINALERGRTGERQVWRNPDTGRYGEVIPLEPYHRGVQDCRDYTHKVYIDGRPEALRGTACRNPDGTWTNVS